MIYHAHIHRDRDDDGRAVFSISLPDVPGCVVYGDPTDTPRTLHDRAQEALGAHLASMRAHGEPIPTPRTHRRGDAWARLVVEVTP
jgi:predicted RNase H-like HicB family nuclease